MNRECLYDLTHPNGKFQPLASSTKFGFEGQLKTHNAQELRDYCLAQPAPTGTRLNGFVQALVTAAAIHPRTTFYRATGSYGLKHDAERFEHDDPKHGGHQHVSNEDFIVAMIQAGFQATNTAPSHCLPAPNYFFNISAKAYKSVMVKCKR